MQMQGKGRIRAMLGSKDMALGVLWSATGASRGQQFRFSADATTIEQLQVIAGMQTQDAHGMGCFCSWQGDYAVWCQWLVRTKKSAHAKCSTSV